MTIVLFGVILYAIFTTWLAFRRKQTEKRKNTKRKKEEILASYRDGDTIYDLEELINPQ